MRSLLFSVALMLCMTAWGTAAAKGKKKAAPKVSNAIELEATVI